VALRAEILTYSRSRGLFAGVSLEGSTLRPDNGATEDSYDRKVYAEDIVRIAAVGTPASGNTLEECPLRPPSIWRVPFSSDWNSGWRQYQLPFACQTVVCAIFD